MNLLLKTASHEMALLALALLVLKMCGVSASNGNSAYEVWAADQSNTARDQSTLGVSGGFLWMFDSASIRKQLNNKGDAKPLSCTPNNRFGPCNTLDLFPQNLREYDANGQATGNSLRDLPGFGRIHGFIKDPFNRYVNANFFTPGGGYVGVIDTTTKQALALFRVTEFDHAEAQGLRSVHMSFWSADGSAIIVANLQGKAIERINVYRNRRKDIVRLEFDRSAVLGLGKSMVVASEATVFKGRNAFGKPLIGTIVGDYSRADIGDLTPQGACKENGCVEGPDGDMGGRVNNVPICPLPSSNNNAYITLGGGGLLVANLKTTPMKITGEYGQNVVFGAGCGGQQTGETMFLDSGVSAAAAGATQSTFVVFAFDDTKYSVGSNNAQNFPPIRTVFDDAATNTNTIGYTGGNSDENTSGQNPRTSTRRDSHGSAITTDGRFLHVVDRIQNVMESFDTVTYKRRTYSLTTASGKVGDINVGPCMSRSVTDDSGLPRNDPTPDLMEASPDGKYLMIAFRGPAPVSVPHSGQGSCPGVGIVELSADGATGKLVDVLRTTNVIPDSVAISESSFVGGHRYVGSERSDVHGAIVIARPDGVDSDPANLIMNGSFESNPVAANTYEQIPIARVTGWKPMGRTATLEVWGKGFQGIQPTDGDHFIELDARSGVNEGYYQNIPTTAGQEYLLEFDMRARNPAVFDNGSEGVVIEWCGSIVQRNGYRASGWETKRAVLKGTGKVCRFLIREGRGTSDGRGGLVDNVRLTVIN